ncbi:glycosyltransferase family 4 protein [Phenylobacterium hankyongense]|uniref:glycosyltransferase family 4 protein n=1 Tax=Phenylobacterium hankyongense TaxID=1813876 RepID=UPI001A9F8E4B|nr:glycosyltransferase family 4 protein [Phenylobacterium hankyongense]
MSLGCASIDRSRWEGVRLPSRLAIFHPPGQLGPKANPFGKDVANLELYRALARHGGFEQIHVQTVQSTTDEALREALLSGEAPGVKLTAESVIVQSVPAAAGTLLRGQPYLHDLAWLRRRTVGDRAYSLLGLVHTLAPPTVRQSIAMNLWGPVQPWDAVICTSPDVQRAVSRMFAEAGDYMAESTGGAPPPQPALPVVPLGVDGDALAALADRPEVRRDLRGRLGLADEDILVLWVGRLSFFEKAFPQPMFIAVQQAAAAAGVKAHFALAGWFPEASHQEMYRQAAAAHAPDVAVHFLDGNDKRQVGELWAASDIFLSLVDNIQETFGITPVEAMAAGLPVVVSDWDGYRSTVRDQVEGFLIPTLIGPSGGLGVSMALRHAMELDSYQSYAGAIAQHTAVHVGRCADALARLIADPELRRRMGAAGRARVRTTFDWPVVVRQLTGLMDELAAVRAAAADPASRHPMNPARGDPFRDFAGFATQVQSLDTRLSVPAGVDAAAVRRAAALPLDRTFAAWRATGEECAQALVLVASGQATTVREVLVAFPIPRRRAVELGLLWMAKYALLDWLD